MSLSAPAAATQRSSMSTSRVISVVKLGPPKASATWSAM